MSLVSGTTEYTGFARLPMVIEAVFEELSVKHKVIAEAEAVLPSDAIFATNTSTIPITKIAAGSKRPEQVIGMHFFSPVHRMPLLEVIVTPQTAPEVTATVVDFGRKIGKTVIIVNDAPGFYVNRILAPYVNEAGLLLDEGVAVPLRPQRHADVGHHFIKVEGRRHVADREVGHRDVAPAALLAHRDGRILRSLEGVISPEEFDAALAELAAN